MGTLLAIALLAVPLVKWLSGTILFNGPRLSSIRITSARRGSFPHSGKSYSNATSARPNAQPAAVRWTR
jgi:hypothetical protein